MIHLIHLNALAAAGAICTLVGLLLLATALTVPNTGLSKGDE